MVIGLLIAAAVLVLLPRRSGATPPRRPLLAAIAIALAIGFYDGFFGPGTGTLLIVGYMWILAEAPQAASANAKVVNFASNIAAVIAFAANGMIVWQISLPMAAGQFIGGTIGAHVVLTRGGTVVRFAAVTVAAVLVAGKPTFIWSAAEHGNQHGPCGRATRDGTKRTCASVSPSPSPCARRVWSRPTAPRTPCAAAARTICSARRSA